MKVIIRKFKSTDAYQASRMILKAFEWYHKGNMSSWFYRYFSVRNLIKNSKTLDILVATTDSNQIIGYISSISYPYKVAYIQTVAVHPKFQKKGIGQKLLNAKLRELKHKKIRKVWLLVNRQNTVALAFYLKNGFVIEGYLKDHTGLGSDEILMSKFL